jgi:hypothetical protein
MGTAWRHVCAEYDGDAAGRAAWSARPTRACEARGARREDRKGGSAREGPSAHGPAGADRPQRAGPTEPRCGRRGAPRATSCACTRSRRRNDSD